MLIFILNKHGKPLMPCSPRQARLLLKNNLAKVIRKTPFTIKLLHGSSGYTQPIIAGMDTGSNTIGSAAISNGKVLYQSEITIRNDIKSKMQQRARFRRTRRSRATRYREKRFNNRKNSKRANRLAPSVKSKLSSHLREKKFMESILPITKWKIETACFDIHKIINPDVEGKDYQHGNQLGYYNVKAFVLSRDNYKCQSKRKISHDKTLHVHHVVHKANGGGNAPSNLITLCKQCHHDLHAGLFKIKGSKSKTKSATEIGVIKSQLNKLINFEQCFGYETKYKREKLQLAKTHYNDAVAICCEFNELIQANQMVYYKRHVSKGDYQQTFGKHSEKRIPTGKLFGIRKFDLIQTSKGVGFVKGKRASGAFAIMDIHGEVITDSVSVKKNCVRLAPRKSTIIFKERCSHLRPEGRSFRAKN